VDWRYKKMKTQYKYSKDKGVYQSPTLVSKWKSPLALSLSILAFVILWKLVDWLPSIGVFNTAQDWTESDQVTVAVALPENQENTSLIQSATIAEDAEQPEWRTFTIKSGDNLAYYFQQAGLDPSTVQEVLALRDGHYLKRIYPGQTLKIHANSNGSLKTLQFDVDPLTTFMVQRQANGKLLGHVEEKPIEKRVAFGGGAILDSFFVAGKNAQLDDALIMELANVFAYDIDFAQDIQPNDYFKVLYEEYFVNGVKVGNGPIVAAEFVNNGTSYKAIRYTDQNQQANYYNPAGQSLKKAFIRTPVQFSRISSPFNLQRKHPILHKIRAHRGVDYAAPAGTPVKAVGQGKVIFAGKKGGYGNTLIVQHGPKYTTLYAHLSRFAKGLKNGHSLRQGQIIGYVGSTGLASGPHLHYEFRIDGVHHNPLTVPLPQAEGITGKAKSPFLAYSRELLRLMDQHEKVLVASKEFS
jgi:murein DD-endopeptidase MepM/ murein hydrolase activator NlpD